MPYYTTHSAIRAQLNTDLTDDDALLFRLSQIAARRVVEYCGQNFDEQWATYGFSAQVGRGEALLYLEQRPLLEATAITNGDGSAVTSAQFDALPKYTYPKYGIRLKQGLYWLTESGTPCLPYSMDYAEDAITIAGKWGYVPHWGSAWRTTTLTLGAAATSSATSLTLNASADGILDAGNVIRISNGTTYEQMAITAPYTGLTTTITVERAVNGTTALSFAGTEAVQVFVMDELIKHATTLLTVSYYQSRGNPTGVLVSGAGGIEVRFASDMPDKVKMILQPPYWAWFRGQL